MCYGRLTYLIQTLKRDKELGQQLTWTMLEISIGSMESGKRRMLKSDRDTKAVCESNTLFSSIST